MTYTELRWPDDHRATWTHHGANESPLRPTPSAGLDHGAFLAARERFFARLRLNAEIRRLEVAFTASLDGERR